jgi:hypothetical protein
VDVFGFRECLFIPCQKADGKITNFFKCAREGEDYNEEDDTIDTTIEEAGDDSD